jgi:hypothetical protein
MDRNHVVFPTSICHPDEIVELVKGELATAIQTDMNTDNTDEATTNGLFLRNCVRLCTLFSSMLSKFIVMRTAII